MCVDPDDGKFMVESYVCIVKASAMIRSLLFRKTHKTQKAMGF